MDNQPTQSQGIALHRYQVTAADGALLASGSFRAPHAASVFRHVRDWIEKTGSIEIERFFNGTWLPAN